MTNTDPNATTKSDASIRIVAPSNNIVYGEQVTVMLGAGAAKELENSQPFVQSRLLTTGVIINKLTFTLTGAALDETLDRCRNAVRPVQPILLH